MKKMVLTKNNCDGKVKYSRNVSENQNGETNKNVSIDAQNTSPNSEELSQNQKLTVKNSPLQHVQPFFSSIRSSKGGLPIDINSHCQNVSSTQNSQFFNQSNYSRDTHQGVSKPHISHGEMDLAHIKAEALQFQKRHNLPQIPLEDIDITDMKVYLQKSQERNNEVHHHSEILPFYSFQRNQSTSKNKPTRVLKAFNESQNYIPFYSDSPEKYDVNFIKLGDGAIEINCNTTKPVSVEVSQDTNLVSFIFPNADPTAAPKTKTYEISNPYGIRNVNPEQVNPTPTENCHQQPTSTSYNIDRSSINQTDIVNKLEACYPNTKQNLSFVKKSLTAPRSNDTGVGCFEPDIRERPRSCRTRLFHTNASKNSGNQEDLQATNPDKNPVLPVEEEPSTFAIPFCDDVNSRELVSPKSTTVYEVASIKVDSSKNINDSSQNIPPVFKTKHSNLDLDKGVKVEVSSNNTKKTSDQKKINSTFDTPLNQKDLAETNSLNTSQQFSIELEPVLSSKSAGTNDFISCSRSHLFGEATSFDKDSLKNNFEIGKPVKDSKYLDTVLVKADSDSVKKAKEKSNDADDLCAFGTSLNQELNLSSNKPIFKTLFKKENLESSGRNDKADKLLQDYPNANKLEIEHKPKEATNKHEKSFTEESIESFHNKEKGICTTITQEHNTLTMKGQFDELEQQNMNNHEKSNDHEETLLKEGNTSSTFLVASAEKEAISNNLLTPTESQNFDMIDFTQIDDDNLYLTSSASLNKEFEMAFCIPSSFTKESPISSLDGVEMKPHPNFQPEITAYSDTNVISTKCNVMEIEVKTSPESGKLNKTSSKTILLENVRSKKPSTFDCCVIDDNSRCSEVNSDEKLLFEMTEEYPESELMVSDSEDTSKEFISTSPKKNVTRITRKRKKSRLTVTKRRKSSATKESYSSGFKSFFEDLCRLKLTKRNFKKNVDNLVATLVNPEHLLDTSLLIFHLVRCICKSPTINLDGQSFVLQGTTLNLLTIKEDCIVSVLFKIEETKKSEFPNLVDTAVTTLYNVMFGKEFEFPFYGLVSLCRVLTEICKRQKNKVKSLQLCGELIKLKHQYAPYLIASVASIWEEIFQAASHSDEENMFFRAIAHGVKNEPEILLDSEWKHCHAIFSQVLPVKAAENRQIPRDVRAIIQRIKNKRLDSNYDKYFLLTTPLVIYTQVKGWNWAKKNFIEPFIVHSLKEYSNKIPNKKSFEFMINLYAEIYVHCPDKEDPRGLLKLYFEEGTDDYAHFTAGIALVKLIMWKGELFLDEMIRWINKWTSHSEFSALQALFQRRLMKEREFSIIDIIKE